MQYFDHMALFVAVVQQGGFSKAAAHLGMPQSSLSRKISELEQHFGTKLLHRSTRRLQLSEAGQRYYARAAAIVAEAAHTHERLLDEQAEPRGELKLSVLSEFALEWLYALLPEFHRRYPQIDLHIDVSAHKADLLGGQADLAVRAGQAHASAYIARPLLEARFYLYAAPEYLRRHGRPQQPQDLAQHRCLGFSGQQSWRLHRAEETQDCPIHAFYQSNSYALLNKLAQQGMGIALLPDLRNEAQGSGRLIRVLPDWQGSSVPIVILTATRLLPAKVRCMVEFLREQVAADKAGSV